MLHRPQRDAALDCLRRASVVDDECPHSRNVSVIYDGCLLRYADAPFFGAADTRRWALHWSTASVADAVGMNETRWRLLDDLAEKAGDEALLRYTSGGERYTDARGDSQVLYGLAQCTRDLEPGVCAACLKDALSMVRCTGSRACETARGAPSRGSAAT